MGSKVKEAALELNHKCLCKTLDVTKLTSLIDKEMKANSVLSHSTSYFSHTAFFISRADYLAMTNLITLIEKVLSSETFKKFLPNHH